MNKSKNRYFLLLALFCIGEIFSQQNHLNIIPEPLAVELKAGEFTISESCTISLQADFSEAMPSVLFLQTLVEEETGVLPVINVVVKRQKKGNISIIKEAKITNEEE